MVDDGFITLNPKEAPIKGFSPPANWRQHPQEWIIQYTRPKALSQFVLRCSLQEATGRLFIHASETGPDNMPRRENIQVLGLQLANYTSKERCEGKSWLNVIQNERTLMEMFREFVSRPLWDAAEKEFDVVEDEEDENDGGNELKSAKTTPRSIKIDVTDDNAEGTPSTKAEEVGEIESSSRGTTALASMNSSIITRKNILLAAAVGTTAATAYYFYKMQTKETGKYVPAGDEIVAAKLNPSSFTRK
jgi:hypothetical protein